VFGAWTLTSAAEGAVLLSEPGQCSVEVLWSKVGP
jgi:hypothetical protein